MAQFGITGLTSNPTIFEQAIAHFRVMETLTTRDYLEFRDRLIPASGFQSPQHRLIEFMLGDLQAKLKTVGRLDALDAVGDKALAYYAAQDLGHLDADSLGRRARALHMIGSLAEQLHSHEIRLSALVLVGDALATVRPSAAGRSHVYDTAFALP